MSRGASDWREDALNTYRLGRLELDRWRTEQAGEMIFTLEDLREALLDLKQATIAGEQARAVRHIEEVKLILMELRLHGGDTSND